MSNLQNMREWIFIFFVTTFIQKVDNVVIEDCTYNKFMDGNVCKECPIGHFGRNCSNKCSPPNFGYLCGQECPSYCKTCHYIFGCTITTETKETMSTRIKQQKSGLPLSHVVSSTTNVQIITSSSIKRYALKNEEVANLTTIPNMFNALSSVKQLTVSNKRVANFTAIPYMTSSDEKMNNSPI